MPNLTPEQFSRYLRGTVLLDISAWSVAADRFTDTLPEELEIRYAEKSELMSTSDSRATILTSYGVRIHGAGSSEILAEMEVTFRAVYEVPEAMQKEIYDQFKKVTLRIHTVPFAREWFRDMSSRMGLDPIVLPLALAHPAAARSPRKARSSSAK